MSLVCHLYVLICHWYVISMSLVCNHMSSVCHLYVLICHPYVTRMSLVRTCMSPACQSNILVFHPYATRMYLYVTRMALACNCMSLICHSSMVLPRTCKTAYLMFLESLFTMKLIISQMSLKSHICCIINGVIRRAKILVSYSQGKNTIK